MVFRRFKKKTRAKKRSSRKKRGGKKKPFGGIVIKPDAKLAAIVGNKALSPAQMTKKIWAYIKRHKLLKR
ncbi:MAG: SWIB/MDM2 domain-containing protein [Candidatus Aenigmatarchaeota archaeon]